MYAVWASCCSGVAVKTSVPQAAPVIRTGPVLHFHPHFPGSGLGTHVLRTCALEVALFSGVLCWTFRPEAAPYH